MALIKCAECAAEISSQAKRCPHCGIKVRRPVGPVGIAVAGVFLVAVFSSAYQSPEEAKAAAAIEQAKTPEQREIEALQDQRVDATFQAARLISRSAYDPDSVKYMSMTANKDGSLVCAHYRAKNAFGALVPAHLVISGQTVHQDADAWRRLCRGTGLIDQTYYFDHY